jgi:excisionase family DNA binding protein
MTRLWSVQDVADYLGVPVKTLYQWRTAGYGPPARRVGRHLRYKQEDVETWFDAITTKSA